MCTLMSTADMPTNAKGNGKNNVQYISWFPKPNNEGENTRVRLLWFLQQNKSSRKTPYFTQMVHDHWGETTKSDGTVSQIVDDTIVCPITETATYDEAKWVTNEKTGKRYLNCPICQKEKEAMAVWKNSGWKDKVAMKRHFALQAKFRAYIPVYIVNDPNNPKNNNRMKVMILTNKDDFDLFDQIVKAEKAKAYAASQKGEGYEIFNGKNGVDLYLHCESVEETKKNGFTQRVRKMTGIAFDDPSNKYDISEINKEAIDNFDMDEQFFVSSTKFELEDFYKRHYGKDETVIPKENVNIFAKMKANQEIKNQEVVKVGNPNPVTQQTEEVAIPHTEDISIESLPNDDSTAKHDEDFGTEDIPEDVNIDYLMDEMSRI